MKVRVPISGTIGKSVAFDPNAGARAEAAVAALAAQINAGLGGSIRHSSLQGLQIGDDHPQYTGNAFPETVTGQWNFQAIPFIQGNTLAEYIEDVVGGSFFDFLQDTSSVVWTFFDTANELEANVPPEFVQDTVGAMLIDTATVDFTYDDTLGQISAVVPGAALTKVDDTNVTLALGGTPATALARAASLTLGWTGQLAVPRGGSGAATLTGYLKGNGTSAFTASATIPYSDISGTPTIPTGANPSASVGLAAVNGSASTFLRSDGAPALDQGIAPTWTGIHSWQADTRSDVSASYVSVGAPSGFAQFRMTSSPAPSDSKVWAAYVSPSDGSWQMAAVNDANTLANNAIHITRSGAVISAIELGANVLLNADNREMQIGASQDLRLYHDGTNSFIENDTGNLVLKVNGELDLEEVTTSTGASAPSIGTNKPGSAVALTPSTWLNLIVNGTTYYLPLWT